MRRAAKRDATENAIVDALLEAGCRVQYLSQGGGVPDLLVRTPAGQWQVLEVKSPGGGLTDQQVLWMKHYGPIPVVQTPKEALAAIGGHDGLE